MILLADPSYADSRISDPYVLKNRVICLTIEKRFGEAQKAIDDYKRVGDAKFSPMVAEIELHFMPSSKLSLDAEELMQKVSSLDEVLATKRSLELGKQCVKQYPESEYAHLLLSKLYFWQLKDSLAISEAYKAVELAPENLHALHNLATCCIYGHREKEVITVLKAVHKTDPRNLLVSEFNGQLDKALARLKNTPRIDRRSLKKAIDQELADNQH